jgi:hypothetical protein
MINMIMDNAEANLNDLFVFTLDFTDVFESAADY